MIVHLGQYREVLVVIDHIRAVTGIPEIDRAGNEIPGVFGGSTILMDTGTSIPVPHPPSEVLRRIADVANR